MADRMDAWSLGVKCSLINSRLQMATAQNGRKDFEFSSPWAQAPAFNKKCIFHLLQCPDPRIDREREREKESDKCMKTKMS